MATPSVTMSSQPVCSSEGSCEQQELNEEQPSVGLLPLPDPLLPPHDPADSKDERTSAHDAATPSLTTSSHSVASAPESEAQQVSSDAQSPVGPVPLPDPVDEPLPLHSLSP